LFLDYHIFWREKKLGLFVLFDECMKMMMKMRREEDEEMLKKIRCW
jgi:hypothetical protein